MRKAPLTLLELVRGVVDPMGYELVGVEFVPAERGGNVLRVYIDTENGVVLDDCTAVSRQLSAVLDVEDPIPGEYHLEVSSPGLERPLFEKAHFERFIGHQARIKLSGTDKGRRKYKGIIRGIEEEKLLLDVDGEILEFPFNQIDTARLIPEF